MLYNKFLSQFRVEVKPEYSQWKNQVVKRVHDALLAADLNLTEMVNVFDHNNDGLCCSALSGEAGSWVTAAVHSLLDHNAVARD